MDVYAAGEAPIAGVSGRTIVEAANAHGSAQVAFAASGADAVAAAVAAARPGDTILTLGAGDVSKLADEVVRRLQPVAERAR